MGEPTFYDSLSFLKLESRYRVNITLAPLDDGEELSTVPNN